MLRHKQFSRNFNHNLLLAILFSTVAGIVNVCGLILFNVFTTNLTGHVGEFALSLTSFQWHTLSSVLIWLLSFLGGAFFASFLTNILDIIYPRLSYVVPVIVEIGCLLIVVHSQDSFPFFSDNATRLPLLFFSMGLQNGIVSVVSGNTVRTTHLTGMVTDFGIGLSELIIKKDTPGKYKEKVILNGTVILTFLLGGVIGAYFTPSLRLSALYIPIALLFLVISFDLIRTNFLILKEKIKGATKKTE